MALVDFNKKINSGQDEVNYNITLAEALVGSFERLSPKDEYTVKKVDSFIDQLQTKRMVELDEPDQELFKNLVLDSGAIQIVKSPVLRLINALAPKAEDVKPKRN